MNETHNIASVRRSSEINEFAAALAKIQGEYKTVQKKRTARVRGKTKEGKPYDYSFKYADLGDVLSVALPILSKHGMAFTQPTVVEGGVIYIRTTLMHSSGQWQESDYPVINFSGKRHQDIGEAMTYAKRFAGCAALGIAPEETIEGDVDIGGDADVGAPEQRQKFRQEAPSVVQSGDQRPLPPKVGSAPNGPRKPTEAPTATTKLQRTIEASLRACISVENLDAFWDGQKSQHDGIDDDPYLRPIYENLRAILVEKENKSGKPEESDAPLLMP